MLEKKNTVEKILWNDDFEVNIKQIDDQHRCFIDLVNMIIDNIDKDRLLLERLCDELIAFAKYHFLSEENLMIRNEYPNYDTHRKEHDLLLRRLNENIVGVHFEKEHVTELIGFLFDWFKEHSNVEDKALGKFLLSD